MNQPLKLVAIGLRALDYVAKNEVGEEWVHLPDFSGQIPADDATVDFIMVPEVHRQSDLTNILAEAVRVLKPRGVLNLQGAETQVRFDGIPPGLMLAWVETVQTDRGPWAFIDLEREGPLYKWEEDLMREVANAGQGQ